jgi:signal transduction histidine kinase
VSDLSQSSASEVSEAEARQKHARIRGGLARANAMAVLASLISIGLAVIAGLQALQARRHAHAAQAANARATEELWNAQLAQARALRWSGKVGRRAESLQAIQNAARIRSAPELRDEAIAALALVDVQPGEFWRPMPPEADAVAFSSDLEYYAWGTRAGRVELYRARDHAQVGSFTLSNRLVMSLTFGQEGRYLAARFLGGALQVWDLRASQVVFTSNPRCESYSEHTVEFHPRASVLAVADSQGVWLLDTRTWATTDFIAVTKEVAAVRFSPDGNRLGLAAGRRVEIWDPSAQRLLKTARLEDLAEADPITDLRWHPTEDRLAVARADGKVTLLDARSAARQNVKAHTMVVTRVLFDPAGEVMVSTSWDGTTRFWDARSGRPLLTTQAGYAAAFDTPGRRLFYYKERLGVGAWDYFAPLGFSRPAVPISVSDRILGIDFSPDGQWLAGTTTEGVHVWRSETGEHEHFLSLTNTQRAAFAGDSRGLVVSTSHGLFETRLLATPDGGDLLLSPPALLPETDGCNYWLGFITQGRPRQFAAASSTHVAVVPLDAVGSFRQIPWRGLRRAAAASPDGRFVVTSAWKGGGTHVWDNQSGRPVVSLEDEGGLAWFSPDGRQLAVGSSTEFWFYDTASWQCTARRQRDVVSALSGILAYSADGRRLALTHGVRQVRLLDADTHQVLADFHAPDPERVTALSFNPDGRLLAAATDNREIHLWHLDRLGQELKGLGLGWGTSAPAVPPTFFAAEPPLSSLVPPGKAVWLSGGGACLAGLYAFYSLRHHRRLISAYADVEEVATKNRAELRAAQSQLLHSEKMKALGTLAAGIAHDFNNLLSIIRMAGQLVERDLKPTGPAKHNLQDIEQATVQGKQLVRSILGYSRQPQHLGEPYSVQAVVGETLTMLSQQFLSGIVLTLELAPDAPPVRGDKSRLEQVLLNLIVNASEAMGGVGKLLLGVRRQTASQAAILPPRAAPEYVELTVRDFGPGISHDILPRVFEPFFTTKHSGVERGTGLGLTTVYTIAQQDGWGLDVDTKTGQGTAFRILLPVESAPAQ